MKKLLTKPGVLPAILLVLYLFGLILGSCAVSAYPIYRQMKVFQPQAQTVAREQLVGSEETLKRLSGPNVRILIYDAAGNCLRHVVPTNSWAGSSPGVPLERYTPAVLSGKNVFKIAFAQETQRPWNDVMVVVGAPMIDQNSIVGCVFLVKNLLDLPEAITGYVIYFTIFYWLSAYFIVSNIRKNKKLDELRQNYIANVTHALKTPVASIKALSETLCDGVEPDPDQQKLYCGMILREANRQDHMIRDILELSKLQSSGMDFTKSTLVASTVFTPVLEKYTTLCDYMDITLHISDSLAQLPALYTNASCVKQVLELLLDNALKFVPEGGNIWVDASVSGKTATICVRDDGIGIEKDALPQVFDRFFKGSHDFNSSGSGLGLAIAKEITAGLKEHIWVESEAGKGAAFFFTIHLK